MQPDSQLHVKRVGVASFLFAAVWPWSAKAATVTVDSVTCRFAFKTRQVPLGDVKAVEIRLGRRWATLRIRHGAGTFKISGLFRGDAQALADALENARAAWWRRALAPQIQSLRSIHDRVTQLADPPKFVHVEAIRDLAKDAQSAAGGLVGRWPDSLSDAPEIHMLMDILRFLESPDEARAHANEAFVANELIRSQGLFDTIEVRPLTDEQRRAVASDDRRNLVVAAAGSGKTSVIVAKTGWLIRKGYRRPSELLLLAFARDARNEMEGRIRKRLGAGASRGVTVRTCHSLGMSIIGHAEGRKPALARAAQSNRALFDLIREIVADLLTDGAVSGKLLEWFRDRFAPYKSQHEFDNWGEYWNYIRAYDIRTLKGEPPRDCRRLFAVSQATSAHS